MIQMEKMTKTVGFTANWGSEKDMDKMTLEEALGQLDKVLRTYDGFPPTLRLLNDVGALYIDITTARDRKRFREMWECLIFMDVYGMKRGVDKFVEYKEMQEEEAKLIKEVKYGQKSADRANA